MDPNPINTVKFSWPFGNHMNRGPLYVYLLGICLIFINFVFTLLETATLVGSIVGGLIAALVLLVILYAAVKWRRKTPSPGGSMWHST